MSLLPFLVLVALTTIWIALPLIPAFRELFRPTDATPLSVVTRDAGNLAFFAERFHGWLESQLQTLAPSTPAGDLYGKLSNGNGFLRVRDRPEALARGPLPDGAHDRVVVTERPVELQGGEIFLLEVCARDTWDGGPRTTLRAIYGERDVALGAETTILRWAHADQSLTIGPSSSLYGRISAKQTLRLAHNTTFERIGAPTIEIGDRQPPLPSTTISRTPWTPPEHAEAIGDHLRISGDLHLPEATEYTGHLVVTGEVRLGRGSRVNGSIKAHKNLSLADTAVVTGATVSRTVVQLGTRSVVGGPIIAEDEVVVGGESVVGEVERQTSIVAPSVRLGIGATVHGQVNTSRAGTT